MTRGQRSLFPDEPRRYGRIRRGFDETLRTLREADRVTPADAAVVALCRVLADQLDGATRDRDESRFTIAAVAGKYRDVLAMFLERATDDAGGNDELDAMLAQLFDAQDPRPSDA